MQGSDQLLTIAEIGVALAGFTGVIGAVGMRGGEALSDAARLQVWLMLEFSLGTVFFSLIPFAPLNFGATEAFTWSISSGLMALFILGHMLAVGPRVLELVRRGEWVGGFFSRLSATLLLTAFIIQGLNSLGFFFSQAFGPYYLGLLLFLLLAASNFILLMVAIWGGR